MVITVIVVPILVILALLGMERLEARMLPTPNNVPDPH